MLQVAQFTAAWEAVDADLCKALEVQAEQALRCREARDALWGMCDARLRANEDRAILLRWVGGKRGCRPDVCTHHRRQRPETPEYCHRDSAILQEHCAAAAAVFSNVVQLEVDYGHAVQGLAASSAYALHGAGTVPVAMLSPPDLLKAEAKPLPRGRADKKVLA